MDDNERAALAWRVAHCPHFLAFDAGAAGACTELISSQQLPAEHRYQPEAWTGRISEARILFVASNPNTIPGVPAPQSEAAPFALLSASETYFDRHSAERVPTWRRLPAWSAQMLGHAAVPGRDFAITDSVRCASREQRGVWAALPQCSRTWLEDVIRVSAAAVIACCGSVARAAVAHHISQPVLLDVGSMWGPGRFYDRERLLLGLPHPADRFRAKDDLASCGVSTAGIRTLTEWLKQE